MAKRQGRVDSGEGWAIVRRCPSCGRLEGECRCDPGAAPPRAGRPVARLRVEKRQGKAVTVAAVEGIEDAALTVLARELRRALATGGTVRGQEMEFQGEHRERLRDVLRERGFAVKG